MINVVNSSLLAIYLKNINDH